MKSSTRAYTFGSTSAVLLYSMLSLPRKLKRMLLGATSVTLATWKTGTVQ